MFVAVYLTQTQTNFPSLHGIGACDRSIQAVRTYASDYREAIVGRSILCYWIVIHNSCLENDFGPRIYIIELVTISKSELEV